MIELSAIKQLAKKMEIVSPSCEFFRKLRAKRLV